MKRILALDWDEHEIRYVLARVWRGQVTITDLGSQELVDVSEAGERPRPDVEGSLRALLSDRKFSGACVVIGVESARVELLPLELPPAEDRELPELVLNQVVRQLQQAPEQLVVDFLPLEGNGRSRRKVLAAVLTREELDRIRELLRRMRLRPARIVFRPLAVASLLSRLFPRIPSPSLLINKVGLQADMTVLVDNQPVFFRSVRLPESSPSAQLSRLVLEAERTVTVTAASSLGGEKLARAFVFGLPGEHTDLVERLGEQLSAPVELVDPFQTVRVAAEELPEGASRFSAHVGMILEVATGVRPAVDFLHVRRPPPQIKRSHIVLGIVGAMLLLVAAGLWTFWSRYSEIAQENAALEAELRELTEAANKAARQQRLIRAVADWVGSEIVWLDELADLSLKLPAARHLVVTRLTASSGTRAGGSIFVQGFVRDPRILQHMEYSIRDKFRRVETPRIFERHIGGEITWSFESSVVVSPREPGEYLLAAAGQTPASEGESADALAADVPPQERTSQLAERASPLVDKSSAAATAAVPVQKGQ